MKNKIFNGMKKYLEKSIYIIIALLIGVSTVYATSKLTPPETVSNTMYSLEDIYNLAEGTTTDEGSGTIQTTPATIAETGKTLTEVYDVLVAEITKLTPSILVDGDTVFGVEGSVTAATPAPTFASADAMTYNCSWFTDMTDPDDEREIPVTSAQICGYNTGCSWVDGACTGSEQTASSGYMSWYAAKQVCDRSEEDGIYTWRLPTNIELLTYYIENNVNGNPPPATETTDAFERDSYWSGRTYQDPASSDSAYNVNMSNGDVSNGGKDDESYLVRCAH